MISVCNFYRNKKHTLFYKRFLYKYITHILHEFYRNKKYNLLFFYKKIYIIYIRYEFYRNKNDNLLFLSITFFIKVNFVIQFFINKKAKKNLKKSELSLFWCHFKYITYFDVFNE